MRNPNFMGESHPQVSCRGQKKRMKRRLSFITTLLILVIAPLEILMIVNAKDLFSNLFMGILGD